MHPIQIFVVSKHCDGTIQVLKEYRMTRRLIWGDMPTAVRGDMPSRRVTPRYFLHTGVYQYVMTISRRVTPVVGVSPRQHGRVTPVVQAFYPSNMGVSPQTTQACHPSEVGVSPHNELSTPKNFRTKMGHKTFLVNRRGFSYIKHICARKLSICCPLNPDSTIKAVGDMARFPQGRRVPPGYSTPHPTPFSMVD